MGEWVDVESLSTLERHRKMVVDVGDRKVAVFYVDGQVRALDNTCIHKQREIGKGVILGNRVVCPGHQWAFDLDTGFEEKKCRYQPVFETRVEDGRILVAAEPSAIPGQEAAEAADGPAA